MIEKFQHILRINKLRAINIYEEDYNLLLKFFWPKISTKNAEAINILGKFFDRILHSHTILHSGKVRGPR